MGKVTHYLRGLSGIQKKSHEIACILHVAIPLRQYSHKGSEVKRADSGTVDRVIVEDDGDAHIQLSLDPAYSNLTNSANDQYQYGDLVVEVICAYPVITLIKSPYRISANTLQSPDRTCWTPTIMTGRRLTPYTPSNFTRNDSKCYQCELGYFLS